MNIVAFFHAYKFTHFSTNVSIKTEKPENLPLFDKLKILLFGINNPKPKNLLVPDIEYGIVTLQSENGTILCWYIPANDTVKETVALFHGYSGSKSDMLDRAEVLHILGYNTLLVDFMGSGDSEGTQTSLGFYESADVKAVYDYLKNKEDNPIYLYGVSMGAVAILKAMKDYNLEPKGILLECPFGTMYQTVSVRFRNMNIPPFPMAGLLVFWGGLQNNFYAFDHNPVEYATNTDCPVLLMYGEQDEYVNQSEIDEIYSNLQGDKTLATYPLSSHESYILKYKDKWADDVKNFLR
ncbi:MAG: alpha/beta fold hydrolase [Dysgonomonas sp.]|nr:alpha/beta fold hydrolase [Dysgonomonas sp.]